MITLPGNLTSLRAGPILCPGAPVSCQWDSDDATSIVRGFVIEDLGPDRVIWCSPSRYIGRDNRARVFLSLDLAADLGPTIALRWLGRHYGVTAGVGSPGWYQNEYGEWVLGDEGDAWILGNIDSDEIQCRCVPGISYITNPIEALAAACVHAAGVPRE